MTTDPTGAVNAQDNSPQADEAVELEGGNYELIRRRLADQGQKLAEKARALNKRRQEAFGTSQMVVIGNERIRTPKKCTPRDIVNVDGQLLFGYNISTMNRGKTSVEDVLSIHEMDHDEAGNLTFREVAFDTGSGYLADGRFQKNFADLYQYNKQAVLQQLRVHDGRLLAIFQVNERSVRDVRVFQWKTDNTERITYLDDRGDKFHTYPPSHQFDWVETSRNDHRYGDHPHVSIRDRIFVETVGGDLTVKLEDNTKEGLGIYSEPVKEERQSLSDADIYFVDLGHIILLKIRPHREDQWRYLAYSALTHKVARIDSIGAACLLLPEDHGVIFPAGIFLNDGELKLFEHNDQGLEFKRTLRAPNGEDVFFIFHRRDEGLYVLLQYNLIRKEVANPILCHGYCLFEDGRLVVFKEQSEDTTVHPMQIWETPFCTEEYAAQQPTDGSFLSRVGNADLVRGISDCLSVHRAIGDQKPTQAIYEELIAAAGRIMDAYHWLAHEEVGDLLTDLKTIRSTTELIIDEFEKVITLRKQAAASLAEAEEAQRRLTARLRPEDWERIEQFVETLARLRQHRGHLITLQQQRMINVARLKEMEAQVVETSERVSAGAVEFLLDEAALEPYFTELNTLTEQAEAIETVMAANPLRERLTSMAEGLGLLQELIAGFQIEDKTASARIAQNIGEVSALLNRTRALLEARRKSLLGKEAVAEFAAQFQLFSQSVVSALAMADTPERCDDQLSRLLIQLEELEGRFSEFDEFLVDLATKREEVYEAFEARKQTLLEARQRRAANLAAAAERIIQGVNRRAASFKDDDELNAWFAADAMVLKIKDLAAQLRDLGDSVKADDIEAKLKAGRDQALRTLRDKKDIFEDGANVIRLGEHRFSVNTQPLELTMLLRDDHMTIHLTGTEFFERIDDDALEEARPYWQQGLVSERDTVYRGEYLAYTILQAAERAEQGLNFHRLHEAVRDEGDGLLSLVRDFAADRYDEGYDRGIHDADAAAILDKLIHLRDVGGLLRFAPGPRALACLFWAFGADPPERGGLLSLSNDEKERPTRDQWHRRARSLVRLRNSLGHVAGVLKLVEELAEAIAEWLDDTGLPHGPGVAEQASAYLVEELGGRQIRFVTSTEAAELRDHLWKHLDGHNERSEFESDLQSLENDLPARLALASAWLEGLVSGIDAEQAERLRPALPEAAALLLTERALDREVTAAATALEVHDLLGQHPRVTDRTMKLRLDEFLPRLHHFCAVHVPGYRAWRELRAATLERERERLRLEEFKPRVLTSFVRNKLISEVYLPMIGNNLATQMGALGDNKRTDLMGLLLLISPPGYGKTTLMEYVANRLGLIFMKINGPALGHNVTSLDPSEAPNATARQELLKLNLALEMGNNVMLYVDDIQHTHPEFLQKFISLCDAQRRIEGVWKNRTRTYDLRGKKFCVIMAGNPYTESGESFQIPDMLANRAETRNLGDILSGRADLFALSYLENTLTSNPTLQPLAMRNPEDTYKLIRMAQGEPLTAQDLHHGYTNVEVSEIVNVLKHLFAVQDVLLKVNQAYIASAGQDDDYRTEPPFKLQGSYRNMNKVAAQVVSAMTEEELQSLVDDHYIGEAQTLTTGAEANLLKLSEMRDRMSDEQRERWHTIRKDFQRIKRMGGAEDDPVARVTAQLSGLVQEVEGIHQALATTQLSDALGTLGQHLTQHSVKPELQSIQSSITTAAKALAETPRQAAPDAQRVEALAQNQRDQFAQAAAQLTRLADQLEALSKANLDVKIVNQPSPHLEKALTQQVDIVEWTLVPLVRTMAQHLQGGRQIDEKLNAIVQHLRGTDHSLLAKVSEAHSAHPVSTSDTQGTRHTPAPTTPPRAATAKGAQAPSARQARPAPRDTMPLPAIDSEGWPEPEEFPEITLPEDKPGPTPKPRGPKSGVIRPKTMRKKRGAKDDSY